MDAFTNVLEFLATNIFSEVAILIGLITMVGLLLQRAPIEDTVAGSLRAAIGVIVLFIGVDVFVEGLVAFQTIVASAVGLEPPTATNTLADFLGQHGGSVALIIALGFLLHLIVVRVLGTRYVYLTGHLLFWISVVVAASLVQVFGDVGQWTLVAVGSIVVAAYWTIQPLALAPLMRRVIKSDDWGFGHTSSLAAWMAGTFGRFLGDRERHDTEQLRLPKQLSFFKDVNVSTALVIAVILLLAAAFADPTVLAEQATTYNEDINPWMWTLIASLRFAAGIAILLFGVRMFLAEIVPAFKGISERLIPASRPALDAPTVFPFAPTAVMLGFVSSTIVFLVFMGIFAAAGWFVLVPPMIMLFFPGAAAAVFGNAVAGWRGAVLGGAINGTFLAVGQAVTWGLLSDTAPELATLADPDWYVITWLLLGLGSLTQGLGEAGIWVVAGIIVVAFAAWMTVLKRRVTTSDAALTGEAPFARPDAAPPTTGSSGATRRDQRSER
ncbi:PTS ascorbate transporter subunit IIC [Egicoccus sp. AB-alg2]|uniref:PTS ascorbate transporter subunit IIC n=1 Tax=Egicoccus sp. AB-alg2 TaxID=3242693 RepID=UPI00359EEA0A